ncbi:LysE family transporter [Aureisphaera galaxeae]|uniref:LysE family transporter n=1 Tax=Aureisphaera galaxeae TaxID=1538023 RepID=UPI0023505EE9|nr:LysE family transporter [Aureisphaera galaxeae]
MGFFLIGTLLSILGAIPLGASNLAVVSATSKHSLSHGMKVAYGAGVGEVALAFFALNYSMVFSDFFEMNQWVQITFMVLLFIIGLYFLTPKKLKVSIKANPNKEITYSRFLIGFFLSFINPPVLLYWILAISIAKSHFLEISDMSPTNMLLLFFTGVFMGKVLTLFFYGKLSDKFKNKKKGDKTKFYRIIGISLILISFAQMVRYYLQ